ncbi:MAG: HAD family phosphatase [Ferruginibacter sp.]|nr:HAD family phosphatase [Ferruginibacter sp.]
MTHLKNIIFDLGGVLINLDFKKSTDEFRALGFLNFENMFSQFKADKLFEKLEKGLINSEDFYTVLLKVGKEGTNTEQLQHAWNSMLLDFRMESLAYLSELKKTYNLFLLSNTNAIHLRAFNNILKEQTGLDSLENFFTKSYYSHLVGLRKPNNDIFEFVLADAGININETLFIDDTKDNIEAAAKMGFKTHLLLPGEKIENLPYENL